MTLLEFRRKLALALIYNDYIMALEEKGTPRESRKRLVEHRFETAPCTPGSSREENGIYRENVNINNINVGVGTAPGR